MAAARRSAHLGRGVLLAHAVGIATAGCSAERPLAVIPYTQDFASAALGPEWSSTGGGWRVVNGALFNDGARNVPLFLSAALPQNVRVTFDASSASAAVDLKAELFTDGRNHQSGYVVILAGWGNSKSIIARLDEHAAEQTLAEALRLREEARADPRGAARKYHNLRTLVARADQREPNHRYRFCIERQGHELRFLVDDALVLSLFDPSPLAGPGQDRFAFNNWASRVTFDNLRIEALGE